VYSGTASQTVHGDGRLETTTVRGVADMVKCLAKITI